MTRTPLSRSKGQGHQAALLTAVLALARQAAAAVGVRTGWPWEIAATLPSAGRRKALRLPRVKAGGAETYRDGLPHTACFSIESNGDDVQILYTLRAISIGTVVSDTVNFQ